MVSDARAQNSVWMVSDSQKIMDAIRWRVSQQMDAQAVGVVPICSNSPGRRLADDCSDDDDDDDDDDSDSNDDDDGDDDDHPHLLDSPGGRPAGSNSGFLEFFDSGSDLDSAGLPMLVVDNFDLW